MKKTEIPARYWWRVKHRQFVIAPALGLVSLSLVLLHGQPQAHAREIENVSAFARLYGVVRFFYPSDAAATVDWDRFAVAGVARIRTAGDNTALTSRLRELFTPLGPGIEIGSTLSSFQAGAPSAEPVVAWRYLGPGATDLTHNPAYAAKRTNRARIIALNNGSTSSSTDELFPEAPPAIGDHIDVDLGADLKARVALTLADSQARAASPPAPSATSHVDLDARLADIVVAWNFFRHFYPYLTEAAVDWDARLRPQLLAAYESAAGPESVALRQRVVH